MTESQRPQNTQNTPGAQAGTPPGSDRSQPPPGPQRPRVAIGQLVTGVPGLDEVLGGGIPEYSFNLIAGAPGSGKTTLVQQIMFGTASRERPALFFTVLGEPPLKILRYQQQFSFFDHAKVDGAVRFVNLSQEILEKDLGAVLELSLIHISEPTRPY